MMTSSSPRSRLLFAPGHTAKIKIGQQQLIIKWLITIQSWITRTHCGYCNTLLPLLYSRFDPRSFLSCKYRYCKHKFDVLVCQARVSIVSSIDNTRTHSLTRCMDTGWVGRGHSTPTPFIFKSPKLIEGTAETLLFDFSFFHFRRINNSPCTARDWVLLFSESSPSVEGARPSTHSFHSRHDQLQPDRTEPTRDRKWRPNHHKEWFWRHWKIPNSAQGVPNPSHRSASK